MMYRPATFQVPPPEATAAARERGYWAALAQLAGEASADEGIALEAREEWERVSLAARAKLGRLE